MSRWEREAEKLGGRVAWRGALFADPGSFEVLPESSIDSILSRMKGVDDFFFTSDPQGAIDRALTFLPQSEPGAILILSDLLQTGLPSAFRPKADLPILLIRPGMNSRSRPIPRYLEGVKNLYTFDGGEEIIKLREDPVPKKHILEMLRYSHLLTDETVPTDVPWSSHLSTAVFQTPPRAPFPALIVTMLLLLAIAAAVVLRPGGGPGIRGDPEKRGNPGKPTPASRKVARQKSIQKKVPDRQSWRIELLIKERGKNDERQQLSLSPAEPSVPLSLSGDAHCSLELDGNKIFLRSKRPLLINGVETTIRKLHRGMIIRSEKCKITFEELQCGYVKGAEEAEIAAEARVAKPAEAAKPAEEAEAAEAAGEEKAPPIIPDQYASRVSYQEYPTIFRSAFTVPFLISALLFPLLLLLFLPPFSKDQKISGDEKILGEVQRVGARVGSDRKQDDSAKKGGLSIFRDSSLIEYTETPSGPLFSDYPEIDGSRERGFQSSTPQFIDLSGQMPQSLSPLLSPREVDVLFIHAHPDDEVIDFGALLARFAQKGKRTAVLLFTKGESGLIRGPYTGRALSQEERIALRHQEALSSMEILGVDLYLNLGLPNHPYGSVQSVLSLPELFSRWGGEEQLILILEGIIEALNPELLISVDAPSAAHVHFEHEGAGYLTERALAQLLSGENKNLRIHQGAFLQKIGLLWTGKLHELQSVRVDSRAGDNLLSPREVQMIALKEHRSQIDSYIIALEYAPLFTETEFRTLFWNMAIPMEDYF